LTKLLSKEIAGHRTSAFVQKESETQKDDGFLALLNSGVFYLSDDLQYFVPPVYEDNPELMMVKNNKVVLGIEVPFSDRQFNLNKTVAVSSKESFMASAMATATLPFKIDPALFFVPAGYVIR